MGSDPGAGKSRPDPLGLLGRYLLALGVVMTAAPWTLPPRIAGICIPVVALGLLLFRRSAPPASASEERAEARIDLSPDRLFALGVVLLVLGASGAWIAWISRAATAPPILAISLAGTAALGLALLVSRIPAMTAGGIAAQLTAEQNPTAPWERRHPRVVAGYFLGAVVAVLLFMAVRRNHPPFVPPPGVDGATAGLNLTWLSTILWCFVGLAGAVLFIETAVESRWLTSLWTAALFGLAILVLAGGLAVVYFLALGIPGPALDGDGGRSILWRLPGWGAVLIFGLVRWWRDLAKAAGDRETARGRKAPSS